ncbi:MAG: hypothetical protein IPL52_03530 [Flavobacteriales bacterium]|nr:hypothetical protein [Flavobacteriales bacterium]
MRHSALLLVLLTSCADPSASETTGAEPTGTDALAHFRQLVGEWIDSTSIAEHTCFERWTMEDDSTISGFGHVLAGGDTVFIEDLRLSLTNGNVVYSARVGSQNNGSWVPFKAVPTGPDTLMFENPGHDFPQCITYARTSSGWDVSVTGSERGVDRSEHFRFIRR